MLQSVIIVENQDANMGETRKKLNCFPFSLAFGTCARIIQKSYVIDRTLLRAGGEARNFANTKGHWSHWMHHWMHHFHILSYHIVTILYYSILSFLISIKIVILASQLDLSAACFSAQPLRSYLHWIHQRQTARGERSPELRLRTHRKIYGRTAGLHIWQYRYV